VLRHSRRLEQLLVQLQYAVERGEPLRAFRGQHLLPYEVRLHGRNGFRVERIVPGGRPGERHGDAGLGLLVHRLDDGWLRRRILRFDKPTYAFTMPANNLALSANFGKALFTDTFEAYSTGGTSFDSVDKNDIAGPNQAANGSGNPWWGSVPPNGRINTAYSHNGGKSLYGTAGGCKDCYNLAYRLNGGSPFTGSVYLDWWFYDPLGSGGSTTNFCGDYTALSYYTGIPAGADYPDPTPESAADADSAVGGGMSDDLATGYNPARYQVRIAGDSGGYHNGWFNTNITRSTGWHHAGLSRGRGNRRPTPMT